MSDAPLGLQVPTEIGSATYIIEHAGEHGCPVLEHKLEAEFRCAGSDGFVNWVNNTLGIERAANVLWDAEGEEFDFRIFPSVEELDQAIRKHAEEGFAALLTGPG